MSHEKLLNLFLENVKDYGIFLLDAEGKVTTWNAGAERILGYESDEIVGQSFDKIFTAHDVEKDQPRRELEAAVEKGRAEDERWHIRRDGSRFWAMGVVTPLWNDAGELQGFAKILRDITDRKKAEDEAIEENQRKDEFLAMLSHELRNPLAAISVATQAIQTPGQTSQDVQQAANIIERQLAGLEHMVNDLLDVSRITRGKIQIRRERVTLNKVVEDAIETTRSLMQSRRHQLQASLPQEPIWIDGDATRLEQIVSNLLANAAKYTDVGGQIWLTIDREGNEAIIRVKDTGTGIMQEMLPRIFELFTQADRSLDRSQGGLGIGLTLTRRLVEMHGGKIEAFSEGVSQGSEFVVRLPVVAEIVVQEAVEMATEKIRQPLPLRLLLVEDNQDTAVTLAALLTRCGHRVDIAHSGPESLELATKSKPDLILLDIGLPGMDGFQVAERLKHQEGTSRIPLVAMTGYGSEEDKKRCEELGFLRHMVKPIKLQELQAMFCEME